MKTTAEHADSPEKDSLSVIRIFEYFKQTVEKIDTPPISSKFLDINEDAYGELGNDSEDDVFFAHIGIDYPKKYTELAFGLVFARYGAGLSIGNQDYVFAYYESIGQDEKSVAKTLVDIITGLANGQLAVLNTITQDDEKVQAWELLYRQPKSHLYDALATYASFDSARKLKNRELTTQKFANTADIKDADIDIEIYKLFTFETSWLNKFNRTQIAGLHVPLTRADWERSVDQYYDKKADEIIEKVDTWANKDKRTTWEQVLDAAKWRHLEMMWWSLALLLYKPVAELSLESVKPGLVIFGAFVILATIYRRDKRFYKNYPYIRVLAYIGFMLASIVFVTYFNDNIWWYILGALALVSLAENIFFDTYFALKKPSKKVRSKSDEAG